MTLLDVVHGRHVHRRRVRVLRDHVARLLPPNARVLDVGCGDGALARSILDRRRDVDIRGIDVLVRDDTLIPVEPFDGVTFPAPTKSYDAVMFVDVLHHTDDVTVLLREASRVARTAVVIKDHLLEGTAAGPTLRFMDWVGNARHGVRLPYNYLTRAEWSAAFADARLEVSEWRDRLALYLPPATWAFDRSLHFVARLAPR